MRRRQAKRRDARSHRSLYHRNIHDWGNNEKQGVSKDTSNKTCFEEIVSVPETPFHHQHTLPFLSLQDASLDRASLRTKRMLLYYSIELYNSQIIIWRRLIFLLNHTFHALVNNDKSFLPALIQHHRLHHSMATRISVPRLMIHMLAPETFGAMAAACTVLDWFYRKAAMCADEWFIARNECHTLNRNSITSPSFTTYSFPSDRIFPFSLAPCSPPSAT